MGQDTTKKDPPFSIPPESGEEEKESRRQAEYEVGEQEKAIAAADKLAKKGGKKVDKKKNTAEKIKEDQMLLTRYLKDHQRDLMKLSNLKTLKALQDASCETMGGKDQSHD
jgi:hypothetical protein